MLCGLNLRGVAMRRDLSQEPERAGLGASLLELAAERKRLVGPVKSLVHSACQQTAFAEANEHEHTAGARRRAHLRFQCNSKRPTALNSVVTHGLLDERQRIGDVAGEGLDVSQARRGPREEDRDALAEHQAT